jgi:alkylation response protein AidB-like acyl-CoA dehydrogenase
MDFTYTEEQDELRAVLRRYLADRSPQDEVRRVMATADGTDRGLWKGLAEEIGLPGIAVPEEFGGTGLGHVELGIALEELGASLACVPFFSTVVLAATALLASTSDARQEWLPRIVSGEVTAALALTGPGGRFDPDSSAVTGIQEGGGWRLSGEADFVLDGHAADIVLVPALVAGRPALFLAEATSPGLSARVESTMDQTRRFAAVSFNSVPARLLDADARPLLEHVYDIAISALSAEQIGSAQRCLDMAVDYARTRFQFGRPIGSFQAIKHKCADLLILLESSRAASGYALWCIDHDPASVPEAAAMAKATASEAFFRAAGDTIQIHGGIGFTWEHPAHLYFKRAKSSELWLGDPALHRERLARLLALA